MTPAATLQSTPAQRWLARLSFALAGLAIVILVVFAELKSLAMFAVGLVAAVVSVVAAYLFLSRRGIVRWLALGGPGYWGNALSRLSPTQPDLTSASNLEEVHEAWLEMGRAQGLRGK